MPTSSQAQILYKNFLDGKEISQRDYFQTPAIYRMLARYSIATVLDARKHVSSSWHSRFDSFQTRNNRRDSMKGTTPKCQTTLLDGYTSLIPFDHPSLSLQQLNTRGAADIDPHALKSSQSSDKTHSRKRTSFPETDCQQRRPLVVLSSLSHKTYVNYLMYERLVGWGFRKKVLAIKDDAQEKGSFEKKKNRGLVNAASAVLPPNSTEHDKRTWKQDVETGSKTHDLDGVKLTASQTQLVSASQEEILAVEECNRIIPSTYMRKNVPISLPLSVVFSFRDNEYCSHADVKYLIETQIGVNVKSIQFDPLDVRVSKLGVHSRWIVDFFSEDDLNEAIRMGLIFGKDKIIFFKHDSIANREVSTFKYFMTIQEAKKALKGSKTLRQKAVLVRNVFKIRTKKLNKAD